MYVFIFVGVVVRNVVNFFLLYALKIIYLLLFCFRNAERFKFGFSSIEQNEIKVQKKATTLLDLLNNFHTFKNVLYLVLGDKTCICVVLFVLPLIFIH